MQEDHTMRDDDETPGGHEDEGSGAEGSSGAKDSPPPKPDPDDDSALGDTDQHSSADA
jgi:hypothetical protein